MSAERQATTELRYGDILEKLPIIRELLLAIYTNGADNNELFDGCVEKLCEAFHEDEFETDAVLTEIKMWICFFTGQSQANKNADRCLWFFVKCAFRMLLRNTVTPRLFTLLVDCIKYIQHVNCGNSRYRCCQLIEFIFKCIEELETEYEPTRCEEEASLPADVKEILVKILHGRIYDKNPFVRAQVIRSLSALSRITDGAIACEHGFDYTEHITNALRDVSRDVRVEAVRCAPLLSANHISVFVSTVLSESDNSVRRLAFGRIARSLHVRSLTVQQRMQLLHVAFAEFDDVLRKMAERMIMNWAGHESVPLLNLLQYLDFLTDTQTSQQVLVAFLKNYQLEMGYSRTSEMVMNLRESCRTAQAELSAAMHDNNTSAICNNLLTCNLIDRQNYANLCQSNDFYVVASRIFLWRCLCKYCKENGADEGDRSESLHILLPDMVRFIDFIYNSLATWSTPTDSAQGVLEEFVIFQLCLLTRIYDQTDLIGMGKWKSTLETIISTRDLPNSEKVLEFVVYELYELFYTKDDQLEEFLEWCCYRLNSFFTPDLNETEELPLTRALLVKRGRECSVLGQAAVHVAGKYEPERHNVQRALLFLRIILRNPRTAKVTTFLRAAFDQVVDTCCASVDPMIWVPLCEVIGIGVAIDGRIARERIHMLRSAIDVDGAPIRVKCRWYNNLGLQMKIALTCQDYYTTDSAEIEALTVPELQALALMAVAACAISRGYATTAQLFYPEVVGVNETTKGQMLLKVFEGFVFSQEEELSFAAVESIGRILHHGCHCFPSALATCLLRYFDSSCPERPYAFLDYFFSSYPASSCIKQHKLVGALRNSLKRLYEVEDGNGRQLLVNVDASKMLNFVAKAVRKAALSVNAEEDELKRTYPPQFFLIAHLLHSAIDNVESNSTTACLGALAYTSPEEFNNQKKAHLYLYRTTTRCIQVLFAHALDKLIPLVRRFQRRLTVDFGENEDVPKEQTENNPADSSGNNEKISTDSVEVLFSSQSE